MFFLFLSSGLVLGWTLGANDAANVFGSAVGSRMIRFRTAAFLCSVFVILGAGVSGIGATRTLGELGSVNALAGSFTVALSAAASVFWMTRLKLPVSTSQAIVGAIIGWNIFSGNPTDYSTLTEIVTTWILCPLLSGVLAALFYLVYRQLFKSLSIHLLVVDWLTRWGLIIIGIFGSYSLGANNIANVVGVFVPVNPLKDISLGMVTLTGNQQLFIIGGIAIGAGVLTYSRGVMETVGSSIRKLSPEMAFIVVLSHSIVLFIFASQRLESFLHSMHLPAFPLVPVSSSQAIVGAIIGISLMKGGSGIKYKLVGKIASGWVITPLIAGIISLFGLFVMQNLFEMQVHQDQAPVHQEAAPPKERQ